MKFPLPTEIKEAIKNDSLVLFVGAGLSRRFQLPDWKTLVSNIIEKIGNEDYRSLIPALKIMPAISALDLISADKYIISKHLEEVFILKDEHDFSFHRQLLNLSGRVITTNYDNAFELADRSIYTLTHASPFKLTSLSEKNKYIYKIHGCAKDNAEDCVLFTKQYEALYASETAATNRLKEQSLNNTFLFLGFSMDDPYVESLMRHVDELFGSNKKHFIITTKPEFFKALTYIKPIVVNNYDELPDLISEWLEFKKPSIKNPSTPENTFDIPSEGLAATSLNKRAMRICLLRPNPLDLNTSGELPDLNNLFDGLDAEVYSGILNTKSLQAADDFDYLFIVTKAFKGKIYIEDESMKSELVAIHEVYQLMLNDQIPIVLVTQEEVVYKGDFAFVNISSLKPSVINKFIFKYLRSGKIDLQEEFIKLQNINTPNLILSKGKSIHSTLSGSKRLTDFNVSKTTFIGRIEEQSSVASRVLKIIHSRKLLNVKGSGGIGKTSLIRKVSHDLHERGYFKEGVTFNSCESIKSYQDFVELLAKGFYLNNIDDLVSYLRDNDKKLDLLIILDNFETIANLSDPSEYQKAVILLEFATDYATIVLTSRENIGNDFEEIYTLSVMNTDDAFQLFTNYYGPVKDKTEILILRTDILENLLNNNPLAIRLVTKTVVENSGIENLKNQLQDFFFETTSEDFSKIYYKDEDLNIERTKSIYNSINYSYCKLDTREKLALEILHLFPDGISVANFKKCFAQKKSVNNITDNEMRSLQKKSLVDNVDGLLRLQPIVRRFAEFLFTKRPKEVKDKYYKDAYAFNCFVVDLLTVVYVGKTVSSAYRLHEHHKENLFLVLIYMKNMAVTEKEGLNTKNSFLEYIRKLHRFTTTESQADKFRESLDELKSFFSDVEDANEYLSTYEYEDIYYFNDFDYPYDKLNQIFPREEIRERVFKEEGVLKHNYRNTICQIHSMEGYTLDFVSASVNNNDDNLNLNNHLFYLGIHDFFQESKVDFYSFEKSLIYGTLDKNLVQNYIESLFKEEHLERMQTTYALSKLIKVEKHRIKPLVVTNPYSNGLKEMMYAFVEDAPDAKKNRFKKALKYLKHIKYYYLECVYFYSKFLNEVQDADFESVYNEGLTLSKKFHYQYLQFKFENFFNPETSIYKCDYTYYPIENLEEYVTKYNKGWRKIFAELRKQHYMH